MSTADGIRVVGFEPTNVNVVIRSSLPTDALSPVIQQAVRAQDPTLPIVKLPSVRMCAVPRSILF